MRSIPLFVALGLAGVAACQPAPAPSTSGDVAATAVAPAAAPAAVRSAPSATPDVAAALASALSEGMAYAELRTAVMAQGWLPLVTPACRENVGGEAAICNELPELDACSGDGRCVMRFGHDPAAPRLRVDTSGDYLQWQATGADATLQVASWTVEAAPAVAAAGACPAADFEGFLAAFAADDAVQTAHTAALVRVMQAWDIAEETRRFASFETRADYAGFRMDHRDDGFHVVDADGRVDPAPTPVTVTPQVAGAYEVSYRYGMSEGNTYRFEKTGDCWTLVGDPPAPSP